MICYTIAYYRSIPLCRAIIISFYSIPCPLLPFKKYFLECLDLENNNFQIEFSSMLLSRKIILAPIQRLHCIKKYLCHEICWKTNSNGGTFQLKLGALELKRIQASRKNLNEIKLNQSNDSIQIELFFVVLSSGRHC